MAATPTINARLVGDTFHMPLQGKAANTTVANNTVTLITFDTALFNNGPLWSAVTNPNRVTVLLSGYYAIFGGVGYEANASGSRSMKFWVNGSALVGQQLQPAADVSIVSRVSSGTIVHFNAGDFLQLMTFQTSGGPRLVGGAFGSTYLGVALLAIG